MGHGDAQSTLTRGQIPNFPAPILEPVRNKHLISLTMNTPSSITKKKKHRMIQKHRRGVREAQKDGAISPWHLQQGYHGKQRARLIWDRHLSSRNHTYSAFGVKPSASLGWETKKVTSFSRKVIAQPGHFKQYKASLVPEESHKPANDWRGSSATTCVSKQSTRLKRYCIS
ncbi:hypothetical protein ONS95_003597 [Cadophora gregata]|uniref:uncharacterized protein n=1 Tax=Cadophora gregata TaxID=51156 RepID=UPI0026DADF24|nr:uncharacterized protein ONS95_003597 [Cadophora gregata]KAK0106875.1 hypothetical protein ONS95_003597 [Cadophora gregata]